LVGRSARRSLQDLIAFLSELHALGIDLFLRQQGLDTTTPAGKAMFQMMGVFAEFERAMIQERVRAAKRAVRHGAPDDSAIHIRNDLSVPLGVLKQHALRTARGHRIAYVVDAAFHDSNVARIIELARGADQLFIETAFLDEDAELAAKRRHLTAAQAGTLARRAGVSRVAPFHFSPRYDGREEELRRELEAAWRG
jgi:hypothetical protein